MRESESTSSLLSIYSIYSKGSRALGPGTRYLIWTQGCPFHCDGCATPQSRPMNKDRQVYIEDLAEDILSRPYIDGITISGGEPFLQAGLLADLLEIILKQRPQMTVITFTGYLLKDLISKDAKRFLRYIDLLIDGPFIQSLNDNKGLRGSSNQQLHFLTPRLLSYKYELQNGARKVELHVSDGKTVGYGIPSKNMII